MAMSTHSPWRGESFSTCCAVEADGGLDWGAELSSPRARGTDARRKTAERRRIRIMLEILTTRRRTGNENFHAAVHSPGLLPFALRVGDNTTSNVACGGIGMGIVSPATRLNPVGRGPSNVCFVQLSLAVFHPAPLALFGHR